MNSVSLWRFVLIRMFCVPDHGIPKSTGDSYVTISSHGGPEENKFEDDPSNFLNLERNSEQLIHSLAPFFAMIISSNLRELSSVLHCFPRSPMSMEILSQVVPKGPSPKGCPSGTRSPIFCKFFICFFLVPPYFLLFIYSRQLTTIHKVSLKTKTSFPSSARPLTTQSHMMLWGRARPTQPSGRLKG